eukprot:jgi/Ulvmu1/3696/UM170_0002.1
MRSIRFESAVLTHRTKSHVCLSPFGLAVRRHPENAASVPAWMWGQQGRVLCFVLCFMLCFRNMQAPHRGPENQADPAARPVCCHCSIQLWHPSPRRSAGSS